MEYLGRYGKNLNNRPDFKALMKIKDIELIDSSFTRALILVRCNKKLPTTITFPEKRKIEFTQKAVYGKDTA